MGWLLMKKHPDVATKGSRIPLDDLLADPVVAFQKKFEFFVLYLSLKNSIYLNILIF